VRPFPLRKRSYRHFLARAITPFFTKSCTLPWIREAARRNASIGMITRWCGGAGPSVLDCQD
jgi:hypothetical protein